MCLVLPIAWIFEKTEVESLQYTPVVGWLVLPGFCRATLLLWSSQGLVGNTTSGQLTGFARRSLKERLWHNLLMAYVSKRKIHSKLKKKLKTGNYMPPSVIH
jgi:hypothetical protein